jgi:hypothetical protein
MNLLCYLKIDRIKKLLNAEHSCNTEGKFQGYDLGTLPAADNMMRISDMSSELKKDYYLPSAHSVISR